MSNTTFIYSIRVGDSFRLGQFILSLHQAVRDFTVTQHGIGPERYNAGETYIVVSNANTGAVVTRVK